jgi:homoserine O-acetyltransferase
MGGMHAWIWGIKYPDYMDALVPTASEPSELAGRNWILRKLLIEAIRNDPDYQDGNYTTQPRGFKFAHHLFTVATVGGTLAYQKAAPTREKADAAVSARLAASFASDANDYVYQWEAPRDYDPSPGLHRIEAPVLAINSADDERNPPETGIMDREIKRVKNARLHLIPASEETRGHLAPLFPKLYQRQLREFVSELPAGAR